MKILFICDNFPPETNAPALRTFEHCIEWVNRGHEVTVLTCFPNFPKGKVYQGYRNTFKKVEYINGIRVIRLWTYITENSGFVKRVIDHFSFAITSFIAGLFIPTNIIIATSPQFFTTFSAFAISKIKNIKWIFEVRDMWPEGIIFLKKSSLLYKGLEKIEIYLYKDASMVITVTESFRVDIIRRSKLNPNKIHVVYNGVSSMLEEILINSEVKRINKIFTIGYAGTLGFSHNLKRILFYMKKLETDKPEVKLKLIGEGSEKITLLNFIKHEKLNNVSILDGVTRKELPLVLKTFDIGLVTLKKEKAYLKVLPSKIFDLAVMRIPILLGVDGEARELIEKYSSGEYFDVDSYNNFLDKIEIILGSQESYKEGLENMHKDFKRSEQAIKMLKLIENEVVVN